MAEQSITSTPTPSRVDVNVPRFNQTLVAILTGVAFVLQQEWLVPAVAAVLVVSVTAGPKFAPFTQIYVRWVRGLVDPGGPSETEASAPPRFAQTLGALFLTAATGLFLAGLGIAGWTVTLVVTALATLAAATRICVGCIFYERVVAR